MVRKKESSVKEVKKTMERKLVKLKRGYYTYLDGKAKYIAYQLSKGKPVTKLILDYVKELYGAAKSEKLFADKDEAFEAAYHNPISSDLEFLIARALYYYSTDYMDLGWKIFLRRQVGKTAPDIRVEYNKETLGIIEIKAKAGWIQPVFSERRYEKDKEKFEDGEGVYDPDVLIAGFRNKLEKYCHNYGIKADQVFVLLPSLILVHRKKLTLKVDDYENFFSKNSELPKDSLILLSTNLLLDLGASPARKDYQATDRFEKMVAKLTRLSKT